jgi:hypothetical protein
MFWTIKVNANGLADGPHEAFGPYEEKDRAESVGALLRKDDPLSTILITQDLSMAPVLAQAWTVEEILAREG